MQLPVHMCGAFLPVFNAQTWVERCSTFGAITMSRHKQNIVPILVIEPWFVTHGFKLALGDPKIQILSDVVRHKVLNNLLCAIACKSTVELAPKQPVQRKS